MLAGYQTLAGFVPLAGWSGGGAKTTAPGTLREAVYARLAGSPALSAIVGDRVFPGLVPQGEGRPSVGFVVASRTFGRCFKSPNRTSRARVRVSCWSYDQLEAATMADVIRRRFDGYQGWWGLVWVYYVELENEIDLPEVEQDGSGRTIYQIVLDFGIRHKVSRVDYGL